MKKIRVGIVFGGRSLEHEVSLISAKNVIEALDKDKYELILISIDKNGVWHRRDSLSCLMHADDLKQVCLQGNQADIAIVPLSLSTSSSVDVVFPILHGTYGEDGTVQGLLKLAGIPFVGSDVLASAACMDKDVTKRLLKEAGLPVGKFLSLFSHEKAKFSFDDVVKRLGLPFFVKPANAGSSVGISKVKREEDFISACEEAFSFDRKILLEEFTKGREIECAILGNEDPAASLPGEIIPTHDFYSYEAKYLDAAGAVLKFPADLPVAMVKKVQELSIMAFKVLGCEGMARVDFLLREDGALFINEINTIPGFTNISMYPKLWQVSGLPYKELLDRLISLAIERKERENCLKTEREVYESVP